MRPSPRPLGTTLLASLVAAFGVSCADLSFRIHEENDVAPIGGGTDRYYTQGLRLQASRDVDDVPVVTPALRLVRLYPASPGSERDRVGRFQRQIVAFSFGQNIYTPQDISIPTLQPEDRPYAGWLYGGASHHVLSLGDEESREDRLDSIGVEVGVVGPSSLAGDTQTWWHHVIGVDEPRGWDHQLQDEVGANLAFQRRARVRYGRIVDRLGLEFDVVTGTRAAAGTIDSSLGMGSLVRVGHGLRRDFGPGALSPPVATEGIGRRYAAARGPAPSAGGGFDTSGEGGLEGSGSAASTPVPAGFGDDLAVYLLAGVDGRFVLRNLFLDGNTYQTSHKVSKERFIADFQIGLGVQLGCVEIRYVQVVRTPEFRRTSDPQVFGAVTVGVSL